MALQELLMADFRVESQIFHDILRQLFGFQDLYLIICICCPIQVHTTTDARRQLVQQGGTDIERVGVTLSPVNQYHLTQNVV